jgi:ABC-type transport system involved in multi-copper enzyme maturation permease subunit
MKKIVAIALISLKEGLRNRVLYGIVLVALFMMAFAILISGFFMRDISKVMLDLCLATVNVGGLLVPFFLAIHLLARDIERRTVFTILSRAISRSEYLLGKFGGLFMLTAIIMALLTIFTLLTIWGGKMIYASYFFTSFSISSVLVSVWLSFCGIMMLNSLVVLWCSMTTSSFLATLLTISSYLIGQSADDIIHFIKTEGNTLQISETVKTILNIVQYLFPNLAAFDYKMQAARGAVIPLNEVLLLTGYSAAYQTVILIIAMAFFRRRELS